MDFTVRNSKRSDLPLVDALLQRAFRILLKPDYPPSLLVTAVPKISRANPLLLASGSYYVAVSGEDVLGCGGWSRRHPHGSRPEPGHAHVRHFATDPDQARRGVGRAIMERCVSDARAEGISVLECYSTRTAEPFYRALGFSRVREIVADLGPGVAFPAVIMVRSIASA
ncbi:MAG: GNAT family N-acetyltransferase [Paracoccaceae bacterium]